MEIIIWGYTYKVVILENPAYTIHNPRLYTTYSSRPDKTRLEQSELKLISDSIREEEPIRLKEEDIESIREILARDLEKLRNMRIINYNVEIYISHRLETRGLWTTYKDSQKEGRSVLICFDNILEIETRKKPSGRGSIIENDLTAIEGMLRNEAHFSSY